MNDLQIFNSPDFGSIRTLVENNGKVLFCAADVAKALGYAKPQNAIATHCKGALKRGILTNGGEQEMNFIPEGDVIRLITHSKLPNAEKFESWAFDEVLPQVLRTGNYSVKPETPELTLSKALVMAQGIIAREQERSKQLEKENAKLKPAAEYAHNMLLSDETLTVTQIALNFGMTANKLNKLLEEWGIQKKVNKQWIPKRKYIDKGYTVSIPVEVGNGETKENTRWNRTGQAFIYKQMHDHGYLTVKEQAEQKAKERKVLAVPTEQPA